MKDAHVIYGPPGTGKSHEIMSRVSAVLKAGADPKSVCLLSFTKAAAQELAERVQADKIHVSTIHSLAFRILEMTRDQVVSNTDLNDFAKKTGFTFTHRSVEHSTFLGEGDFYLACYNLAKATMVDPIDGYDVSIRETRCNAERYRRFVRAYELYKEEYGLMDFSDMLSKALSEAGPHFEHVFIDEAQDLSPAQWALIRHWLPNWSNVHVAGDDDQAIYKWGGADPRGIAEFQLKFDAEVKILTQSYRVPKAVHAKASDVISRIADRVQKDYNPTDTEGSIQSRVTVGAAISELNHGDDVLILYRNHAIRYEACKHLHNNNIPYKIEGGRAPLDSTLAKAAAIWNREVYRRKNDDVTLSVAQIRLIKKVLQPCYVKSIEKGKYPTGMHWRSVMAWDQKISNYLLKVEKFYGLDVRPTIRLSTIHGSKGREADKVIVMNAVSKRTHDNYTTDKASEIRTFYVALTRAKRELIICTSTDARYRMLGFL